MSIPAISPLLTSGRAKADHLARRQTALDAPVDRRHQLVVEAVGVKVEPHPVDALGGQEGRCMVGGVLDARRADLAQVADEHGLAVDVPAAVPQLQRPVAVPVDDARLR